MSQKMASVMRRKSLPGTVSAMHASAAPMRNCKTTIQRRLRPSKSTSGLHSGLMTQGR